MKVSPRRGRRGADGQAMVEFALVIPLLLSIIFITITVSLLYAVRIQEQKAAYDAARHVAKVNPDLTKDLISGCPPNDISSQNGTKTSAEEVLSYEYSNSPMMQSMASKPKVVRVSTGPRIGNTDYYCNMAVSVTISYHPTIPGWEVLTSIYGAKLGTFQETGVAARLANQYEPPPACVVSVDKPDC